MDLYRIFFPPRGRGGLEKQWQIQGGHGASTPPTSFPDWPHNFAKHNGCSLLCMYVHVDVTWRLASVSMTSSSNHKK